LAKVQRYLTKNVKKCKRRLVDCQPSFVYPNVKKSSKCMNAWKSKKNQTSMKAQTNKKVLTSKNFLAKRKN